MPRGAYVDPDELKELKVKAGLHTFVPSRVDGERPEFESEAFRDIYYRSENLT